MKLFATLLFCCMLQGYCSAQAIQKGSFLCTSARTEAWDNDAQKLYITRDWVNLPANFVAVQVYKDSIAYFTDAKPGKGYQTKTVYKIEKVNAKPDIDSFADTEYTVVLNGIKGLITVRLLSGYGGYAGQIKIASGPVLDHYLQVITYTFTKSEDRVLAAN
jgi:hypothetical protein